MRLYQVILAVSDIDRAESFYQQLLGSPGRRVSPGRHRFQCGDVVLTCYDPGAKGEGGSPTVLPSGPALYLSAEDLEATFECARGAGCTSLDEKIVTQPWGDRSFSARDPFGNRLNFVDEQTVERQKDERLRGGPDDRLCLGLTVSFQVTEPQSRGRMAGAVVKILTDEIWLKLSKSLPGPPFLEGDVAQLQFSDETGVYVAETQVVKIPSEHQYVAVSPPLRATRVQRRAAPRVAFQIPMTFSVVDSPEYAGRLFDSETRDMSTGGARFETDLSLAKDTMLEVALLFPPSERINVSAKVISTEPVQRDNRVLASVGVQFVEVELDDQIKILQFLIDSQEPDDQDQSQKSKPDGPQTVNAHPPEAAHTGPGETAERQPPEATDPDPTPTSE